MRTMIDVKGLKKTYGNRDAVKNLSFQVFAGEIFGLLGANGAGKTTTLECILGTKMPNEGHVQLLGVNPAKRRKSLFEKIGVQFQESHFQDKIRVSELVVLTQSLYRETANPNELLKAFGLLEKRDRQVSELSGGERQRLFVVLALMPKPELVFLDELTTGLDTKARREVWTYLKSLKQSGLTIILTSHFMDEVEVLCDRVCILRNGNEVFCGTVPELLQISGCYNLEDAYLLLSEGEVSVYESL